MAQKAPSITIPRRSLSWLTSIREETIGAVPYVANSAQVLPSQGGILPSDRFYYGLRLKIRGRITDAAGGAPAVQYADWPWSLVNRIQIKGYHRPRAADETFFELRGPDIREFFSVTQGAFATLLVATAAAPILTPVLPRTALNGFAAGANLTTDFIFFLDIIFPPAWPVPSPGINRQQAQWLLDAPNYDRLTMTVFWATLPRDSAARICPALEVSEWELALSRIAPSKLCSLWAGKTTSSRALSPAAYGVTLPRIRRGTFLPPWSTRGSITSRADSRSPGL